MTDPGPRSDIRIAATHSPRRDARGHAPWLFVVARGHTRLRAELEALFRNDPRIRVIENRRRGPGLSRRAEIVTRLGLSAG
jgi:hypothetical protein